MPVQTTLSPIIYSPSQTVGQNSPWGTQAVFMEVNANVQVTAATFADKRRVKFVHVDLQNSSAGVGSAMIRNQNDIRGFFIDQMMLEIWCQPIGTTPNIDSRLAAMVVSQAPKGAENSGGSITSTVNFGIDVSGGTFGESPTANAGASCNIGTSFTQQITDFSFENHSGADFIRHVMTMTAGGYTTSSPSNYFVNSSQDTVTKGARLREVPHLAASNLPAATQAVFQMPDSVLDGQVELCIRMTAGYCCIEGTAKFFTISSDAKRYTPSMYIGSAVNLAAVEE